MMKKYLIGLIAIFITAPIISHAQTVERSEWFRNAKFGIFVHWGLYSVLEGSYGGRTMPDRELPNGNSWYAEWIQTRLEVPDAEYRSLADVFDPEEFDADAWIQEFKRAGARYFVITSKHHDGFSLWDTDCSDYKITNTPYGRDILAELVDACRKHGLKYGFYYSHWQDWHHPQGALPHWRELRTDEEFDVYWRQKSLPQVAELVSRFDPDLLWFDTWDEECHINPEKRDELIALVRGLSDKCLINGRILFSDPGNDIDFLEMHDNQYPKQMLSRPWQTPATMTHSWGWHAGDHNWKTTPRMLGYLINNTSKGGNYLLNIGPKPDGTLPTPAVRRLREMGAWLGTNGEAIYSAVPYPCTTPDGVYASADKSGRNIYIFITGNETKVSLEGFDAVPSACVMLETGAPVKWDRSANIVTLEIPAAAAADPMPKVIKVGLE